MKFFIANGCNKFENFRIIITCRHFRNSRGIFCSLYLFVIFKIMASLKQSWLIANEAQLQQMKPCEFFDYPPKNELHNSAIDAGFIDRNWCDLRVNKPFPSFKNALKKRISEVRMEIHAKIKSMMNGKFFVFFCFYLHAI